MTTGSAASGDLSGQRRGDTLWGKRRRDECMSGVSRRSRDMMLAIMGERGQESEGNGQKLCIVD